MQAVGLTWSWGISSAASCTVGNELLWKHTCFVGENAGVCTAERGAAQSPQCSQCVGTATALPSQMSLSLMGLSLPTGSAIWKLKESNLMEYRR